ncbi:adenosine deaminase [Propionibacteriaceae bacterium G1746]
MHDFTTALDALPKVDLHCHIEGTMRPATVIDLARKNSIPLPTADPVELYRYSSLDEFLAIFWLVQSTLATRDDWARLAYEAVVDSAAHGVVHQECFFTPARHLAAGQQLADIVAGLDEGISAAEAETGTSCRLIGDMDRAFGPAAGVEFVEQLVALRASGAAGTERVLGVGLDSTELGVDSTAYAPAYAIARRAGLRLTGHQGENTSADEVAACLDALGLQRLDHGVPVLDSPTLTQRMVDEQIPITVCPTSNVVIANCFARLEDHVYPQMREAGLLATVNTDDPALSGLNLGSEYVNVARAFGYGWNEMVTIALDGVRASWLDDSDKASLGQLVQQRAAQLAV